MKNIYRILPVIMSFLWSNNADAVSSAVVHIRSKTSDEGTFNIKRECQASQKKEDGTMFYSSVKRVAKGTLSFKLDNDIELYTINCALVTGVGERPDQTENPGTCAKLDPKSHYTIKVSDAALQQRGSNCTSKKVSDTNWDADNYNRK